MAEAQDEFIVKTEKLNSTTQQAANSINKETKAVDNNAASLKKTANVLNNVSSSAKQLNTVSKGLGSTQKALSTIDSVLTVDFTSFGGVVRSLIPIMKTGTAGIKALTKAFISNPFTVVIAAITVLIANFSTLTRVVGKFTTFIYENVTASGKHVAAMRNEVDALDKTVASSQKASKSLQDTITIADKFYDTSIKQLENRLITAGNSTEEIEQKLRKQRMANLEQERKNLISGYDNIISKLKSSLANADALIAAYNKKHHTVGAEFTSGELEQEKKIRASRNATYKELVSQEQKKAATNIEYKNQYLHIQEDITTDEKQKSDKRIEQFKTEQKEKIKAASDYYSKLSQLANSTNREIEAFTAQILNPTEWTASINTLREAADQGAKIAQDTWAVVNGITDINKATKKEQQEYEAVGKYVTASFNERIDEGTALKKDKEEQISLEAKYGAQIKNNKTLVDQIVTTYANAFELRAKQTEESWRTLKKTTMQSVDDNIAALKKYTDTTNADINKNNINAQIESINVERDEQIKENNKIRERALNELATLEKRASDEIESDKEKHYATLTELDKKYAQDQQVINSSLASHAEKQKQQIDLTNEYTEAKEKENKAYEDQYASLTASNNKQKEENDLKRDKIALATAEANAVTTAAAQDEVEAKKKAAISAAQQEQIKNIDALSSAMSAASELTEENSNEQIALQGAVATANMASGMAKAIASSNDVPFPGNFAAMASSVAVLLSYFATIKNLVKQSKSYSKGGLIRGAGTGTSDSIQANVSNGESIINAKSTAQYAPLLSAINQANGGNAIGNSQLRVNQSKMTAQYYNPVVSVESINRQTKIYNAVNVE